MSKLYLNADQHTKIVIECGGKDHFYWSWTAVRGGRTLSGRALHFESAVEDAVISVMRPNTVLDRLEYPTSAEKVRKDYERLGDILEVLEGADAGERREATDGSASGS